MKFPKQIKIVDQIYDIIYTDNLITDNLKENECLGQIDFSMRKIKIYKPEDQSDNDTWNTLFHELLHAIIDIFKIEEIENLPENQQEHIIHLLATGLNVIMIDNKLCFKWKSS
jgi:hypothetical protein